MTTTTKAANFDRMLRAWTRALACAKQARRREGQCLSLAHNERNARDRMDWRCDAEREAAKAARWDAVAARHAAALADVVGRPTH